MTAEQREKEREGAGERERVGARVRRQFLPANKTKTTTKYNNNLNK